MDNIGNFKHTKEELDKISPTFCVAKWNQVSLHLESGMTHSCHHPVPHKIPLSEVAKSPHALHNTEFKKEQRKLMLEGKRPKECDYCWRAEDSRNSGDTFFSDRVTKSSEHWALPDLDKVSKLPWNSDVYPTYLEVSFDNLCNFKCMYCSPAFSNTWKQEVENFGPYVLPNLVLHDLSYLKRTDQYPIPVGSYNPYIEAFWKWWPEGVKHLKIFRITGGEPMLSKQVFKVLDYIIDNPQPQMEFNINSNLDAPFEMIDLFIKKMQIIQDKKAVKSFKLYTSNEAYGKQAEYIRFGLNYDRWLKNCHRVLGEIQDSNLTVMSAFNVLSIPSYKRFMDDIIALKHQYTEQPVRKHPVSLDVPYIRWPEFLAPWIASVEYLKYIEDIVTHMYKNLHQLNWPPLCGKGFFDYEINRFERLYYVTKESMMDLGKDSNKLTALRAQFKAYITEYDRRKGTNFKEIFPELSNLYEIC